MTHKYVNVVSDVMCVTFSLPHVLIYFKIVFIACYLISVISISVLQE